MSWLDAHEFYVIEMTAHDRIEELRSARTVEPAPRPPAVCGTPAVCDAGVVAACRTLAKASS
jgi:hypothetical protein